MNRLIMTSTRVEVEKKPLVRVLVLSRQVGVLSENMESQLGMIKAKGNCHIESIGEAVNEEETALKIRQGNYDLVLVDKNITLSAWKIAELTAKPESGHMVQQSNGPSFYLDGAVEDIVDREIHHTKFSGSIGMVKNGKVLLRKSYGNANQSELHETKNEPETKVNIGSITKMFTAVAVAKLVEEGKFKYDDLVSDLLPDTVPNKEFYKNITVKDLLLHTSGLGQFQAALFFKEEMLDFNSIDDYLPMLSPSSSAAELIFKPKTDPYNKFLYSNINSLLLGYIIKKASGKDYCRYIQENVLPRNMMDTTPIRGADQSFALSYAPKPELECDIEADSLQWLRDIVNRPNVTNNKEEAELKQIATDATKLLRQYKEKMDAIFSLYQNGLASVKNDEDLSRFKSNFKESLHQTFQMFDAINVEIKKSLEKLETIRDGVSPNDKDKDKEHLKKLFTDLYKNLDAASEPKSAPYLLYSLLDNLNVAFPASNFRSTAADLLTFQESLWKNKDIINDPELLIREKVQIPGSPSPDHAQLTHYGYGICIWENGTPMESVGHDGQIPGTFSTARLYREAGISIATLANVENGDCYTPVNLIERHLIASCVQKSNIRYFDSDIPRHSKESLTTEIERISNAKGSATQLKQTDTSALTSQQSIEPTMPKKGNAESRVEHYKRKLEEARKKPQPGYMASTESSKAKEREISPLPITPQPPWRR
jgi:CubicO group peptidase (beta-lactamase class C family)